MLVRKTPSASFNNNAFSPSQQTAFVLNLKSLDGVANRGAFVRSGGADKLERAGRNFLCSNRRVDGSNPQKTNRSARHTVGDFPIGIAKDGTIVVALQWDYAAWTSGAASSRMKCKSSPRNPAKQKNCRGSLRTSFTTVARRVGKARNDGAGSTRSRSAQVIRTHDQRP